MSFLWEINSISRPNFPCPQGTAVRGLWLTCRQSGRVDRVLLMNQVSWVNPCWLHLKEEKALHYFSAFWCYTVKGKWKMRKTTINDSHYFIATLQMWMSLATQAQGTWLHNAHRVSVVPFHSKDVRWSSMFIKDNIITFISLVKIEIYFFQKELVIWYHFIVFCCKSPCMWPYTLGQCFHNVLEYSGMRIHIPNLSSQLISWQF